MTHRVYGLFTQEMLTNYHRDKPKVFHVYWIVLRLNKIGYFSPRLEFVNHRNFNKYYNF
jgi:hypothetical protein